MYSIENTVRYSEVDEDKYIRLVSLINYLQDCSTFQGESLGLGVDHQREINMAWVLMGFHVRINTLPKFCDTIRINTWCYELKRFIARRNFQVMDSQGQELLAADSSWTMVSLEDGKAHSIPESEMDYLSSDEALDIGSIPKKIDISNEAKSLEPVPVAKHHLDTNIHVNNAQYIQIALDALGAEGLLSQSNSIQGLDVLFKAQARLGDTIYPRYEQQASKIVVSLDNEAGIAFTRLLFSLA